MFEDEDEGLRKRFVFRSVPGGFVSERDGIAVLFPAGVPGPEMFVVPLLLDKRGAISSEVDQDDAMDFRGHASAASVEPFEIFRVRRDDKSNAKGQCGDQAM